MKTRKISLPLIFVSVVAFFLLATGIASWIITITQDFSLEYSKEGEIISGLDCSPVVYDGNGHLPLLKDDAGINFKDADVFSTYKFEFRKKGEFNWSTVVFDTAYVPSAVKGSAPIDAGDYEIRYTDSTNYSCVVNFTIKPATPTVNNIATLGTTIYGKLPSITQPTSTPATYVLFDGVTENVTGSFTFLDEESTKFNSTVRNYSGEATTTSASTKLLFVPTSTNYTSVEVDATFTAEAVAYCSTTYYCSIEKALEANTSSGTIFVIPGKNPGIYENCTVASGVTLCIPYDAEKYGYETSELITGSTTYARDNTKLKKSEVTFSENVTMTVDGTLQIGGIRTGGGGNMRSGHTASSYSQISLSKGSSIVSSGKIYCYGYIIGIYGENEPKVQMKNGGTIYMPFIVQEHRGGSVFLSMAHLIDGGLRTSPFNRFHFNNIESLLIFEYGSKLIGCADLYASSKHNTTEIDVIGPSGSTNYMISMSNNSVIEGRYVHSTERTVLDIYGGMTLKPLNITVQNIPLSTESVLLPFSWYYDVSLYKYKDGSNATCDLTSQNVKILPGAKLTINEGVTVNATTISAYSNMPVDASGCPPYPTTYPSGSLKGNTIPAGMIVVNGTFNIKNLGGLVLTSKEKAKLNVQSSGVVETQELVNTGPKYSTKKEYLKVYLYTSTGVSSESTLIGVGEYESKEDSNGKCGWLTKTIDLSYDYNDGNGIVGNTGENISILDSSGNVVGYTINISDLPSNPTSGVKEHYEFIGWSLDPTSTYENWESPVGQVVFANTVFYAIWKPIEYTIIYDIDNYYDKNGYNFEKSDISLETSFENGYPQTYNVEGKYELPEPELSGYQFAGWYTTYSDGTLNNRITDITPGTFEGTHNTKLYALWNPVGTKEYTIKFQISLFNGLVDNGELSDSLGFKTIKQSCFSTDGVEYDFSRYIQKLSEINNNNAEKYYYSTLIIAHPTDGDVVINGNSIIISDSNTTAFVVDTETTEYILTIKIIQYEKVKITYNNDNTEVYVVPKNATTSLPTGTIQSIKLKKLSDANITLWFETNSATATPYYKGDNNTESEFTDDKVLYGYEYKLLTINYTIEQASISISVTNTLIFDESFAQQTSIPSVSATTTHKYYFAIGGKLVVSASKTDDEWVNDPSGTYDVETNVSVLDLTASSKSCITADTLITLADGTKKQVQDLSASDLLLVFNHETGKYEFANIIFIDIEHERIYRIVNLKFSDGTIVKVVYEHGFFDLGLNKYVYIREDNMHEFIGHKFYQADFDGVNYVESEVTLVDAYVTEELTTVYSPVTVYHLNYFTEDMLSMPAGIPGLFNIFEFGDNLTYDEEQMQADIEKYGLYTYDDFKDYISYEVYMMFPAPYLKVAVGKGLTTYEDIVQMIYTYLEKHELMK